MLLQKGHHFYAVQISKREKGLTAGVKEVSDWKKETYVIATKDIFIDIVNNESEKNF